MGIFHKLFGGAKKRPEQMSAKDHTRLGYEYDERGKVDEAIREYQEALRIDPNFALARSNLGFIYNKQGRVDDAIGEWEETMRRGVTDIVIHRNTEDWLKEAKALRCERKKQIGDVDNAIGSYMEELGQASDKWFIAYDALERMGTPAVDGLIQAIQSDNQLLRGRAMDLLGKIRDQRAIEPLTRASKISEQEFRRLAGISGASKAFDMGGMQVSVPLTDLLKEYRKNAEEALKKIKKG
jgi:tetratricopeptide (TPR) repeat protein